jgi:acetyl esterase/lipase
MRSTRFLSSAFAIAMALPHVGFSQTDSRLTTPSPLSQSGSGPKPVLDPRRGDGGVSAFYVWEKEVPGTPGQLLRQEPLSESLTLANASSSIRVLYASTNGIDGKTPIAVSGAVYLPKGSAPAGGWPIVAWAHGTTGVADVCAPSCAPRAQRDTDYLNAWLAQGYAVVASDYQGLGTPGGHPWMAVRPEGWSVLDSIRSARAAFPQLANSVVIVGQSQGAHAAVSAALLARGYAPGVNLKGTVATGVPGASPFLATEPTAQIAGRQSFSPPIATRVLTLYLYTLLDSTFNASKYLSEAGKPVFESTGMGCLPTLARTAEDNHLDEKNWLTTSPVDAAANAIRYQQYPTPKFAQPLFVGTGLADTAVSPEEQYDLVRAACRAGSTVEAHYYPGKDHGGTVNASLPDSVPFVKKVLAGEPIASACASVKPPTHSN